MRQALPVELRRPAAPVHLYRLVTTDPDLVREGTRRFARLAEMGNLERSEFGIVMTDKRPPYRRHLFRTVPDDLGRTGYQEIYVEGVPVAGYRPLHIPAEPLAPITGFGSEPWTAADLLLAANDHDLRPDSEFPHLLIGWARAVADPFARGIRAARVLISLSRRAASLHAVATLDRIGAEAVKLIAASDLLAEGELDKLITWRGPLPTNDVAVPDLGGDAA